MYNYNHKITFFFKSCRYKQMFNVHSNTNRLHSSSKDWDSRNTCTCIQTFIFLAHKFTSMTGFTVGPTEYRIRVYTFLCCPLLHPAPLQWLFSPIVGTVTDVVYVLKLEHYGLNLPEETKIDLPAVWSWAIHQDLSF